MEIAHFAALLLSSLVAAPDTRAAPAADSSAIIVEGERDREKQIDQFITTLTPAPVHGQTSRFETRVCPVVVGLSNRQDSYVAERMSRIAEAAGIPVDKGGCKPNVILAVTDDKRALLKRLEKKAPYFFPESWSGFRVHELERDPSPVAAWHIERRRGADDKLLSQESVNGGNVGDQPRDYYVQKMFGTTSRLKPSARTDFVASIVVVQADALVGLTTIQLADYAAMRAFVRTDPKALRGTGAATILSVIDAPMGTAVPVTLTAWDLSFLKAFYASRNNGYVENQRSEMQRLMRRNLDAQERRE